MIKQIDLKETKRILIAQLVLSTIYFLFGVYILISNIINKNIAFNKDLNITLSLIIIGGVYAIYCLVILTSPKRIKTKTIKRYDPSNKDIKDKTIRSGYFAFLVIGLILMLGFHVEGSEEAFVAIFGLIFLVFIFQALTWIYHKIRYNLQTKDKGDDFVDK